MDSLAPVVALLSVFGLGMSFALLGAVSVKLMPRLKIDEGGFGTLISGFMFTCLVASLIVGVTLDKVGYKPVATVGFLALGAAIFIIGRMKSFNGTLVACILLGIGAMCCNTAGNVLGPAVLFEGENPARASNFINVFFGLGLFIVPMLASLLLKRMSYENALSILGLIALVPVIVALLAGYPEAGATITIGQAVSLIKSPAVIVAAFALFSYIALEASLTNWVVPYGKEVIKEVEPERDPDAIDASAQRMMSLFAIAMMAGRLIASGIPWITQYGGYVIAAMGAIAAVVIIIMMVNKSSSAAWILVLLIGLAFAPCFPTIVGVTFDKFDPNVHGSVFGIIFAVGLAGAVIVPKLIGNLSKGSSIRQSLKILIVMCVILFILALVLGMIGGPAPGEVGAVPAA